MVPFGEHQERETAYQSSFKAVELSTSFDDASAAPPAKFEAGWNFSPFKMSKIEMLTLLHVLFRHVTTMYYCERSII